MKTLVELAKEIEQWKKEPDSALKTIILHRLWQKYETLKVGVTDGKLAVAGISYPEDQELRNHLAENLRKCLPDDYVDTWPKYAAQVVARLQKQEESHESLATS